MQGTIFSMAQCVKVIVAIAVFFTYALQFYAPFEVVWLRTKDNFKEKHQNLANYSLRSFVVVSVAENIYFMIVLIFGFFSGSIRSVRFCWELLCRTLGRLYL